MPQQVLQCHPEKTLSAQLALLSGSMGTREQAGVEGGGSLPVTGTGCAYAVGLAEDPTVWEV